MQRWGYLLRPSLRLVDNNANGTIKGDVDPNFEVESGTQVSDSSCGDKSVYVYKDEEGFTAGDVGSDNEPTTTADLKSPDGNNDNYSYVVGFLNPDTYRVAVVCAEGDDPQNGGDEIPISNTQIDEVAAGQTTTINFNP